MNWVAASPAPKVKNSPPSISRMSKQIGLAPLGDDDTYFDNFDFTAGVALGEGNTLTLNCTN
jgi:hypothetical protein